MQKKLLLLFFLFVLLFALYISMPTDLVDAVEIFDANIFLYCKYFDGDAMQNGSGFIVQTDFQNYGVAKANAKGIDGVSLSFDGDMTDIEMLIEKLNVQSIIVENIDTIVCIYGFSEKLLGGIVVGGQKINVQLVYNNGIVSIGSPLILGSY